MWAGSRPSSIYVCGSWARSPLTSPLSDMMTSLHLRPLPMWFPSFGIGMLSNLIMVSH